MKKQLNHLLGNKFIAVVLLCFGLPLLLFNACGLWQEEKSNKGRLLAEVKNEKLYEEDLDQVFSAKLSKKDSIQLQKDYVRNWIQDKLLYFDALENLSESRKNKEKALQSYYESLIRYEYEQKMLKNYLDTAVKETSIRNFYQENQARFELKRPILKYHYMIFNNKDHPFQDLKRWFQSDNPQYLDSLFYYAETRAMDFSLENDEWHYYDEVPKGFDLPNEDRNNFLNRNNFHLHLDSMGKAYIIYIKTFKSKGEIAPLSIKQSNIRQIIINRDKKAFLEKREKSLYEEAIQSNKANRYD